MIGNKFYPTSKKLINKMLEGIDLSMVSSILDPSAGKGDIVEILRKREEESYNRLNSDIDCIEMGRDLRSVLEGRGFHVVADDFFQYNTMKEYDLIITNPPFSNSSSHLMKPLDLQERNGGVVVCLLNAETLKNPYTDEKKVLKQRLEDSHARIEFLPDAFVDAERKNGVEVALMKEMSLEEKAVIDDLQGKEEYSKVFVNLDDYLFSTSHLNLLESSEE